MPLRSQALTPEALTMMDTIARSGSFAAAARALGKVPSALTYSVRQLEDALDVLLFDRRSRQARLTAAGQELLQEGRRLLGEIDAVANRVRRVATGWESELTLAVDDVICRRTLLELVEAFVSLDPQGPAGPAGQGGPGTRLRLRTEVMAGTWEALVSGRADLAIGVPLDSPSPPEVAMEPLGEMRFVFVVAPHHPLAAHADTIGDAERLRWRAVAVADSAERLAPRTVNLLPGQDVLTVSTMQDKLEALCRGLGCGWMPEVLARPALDAGRLRIKDVSRPSLPVRMAYAWRCPLGAKGQRRSPPGLALQWWLQQLSGPRTRAALLGGLAPQESSPKRPPRRARRPG
jgi:DNA-binding transcriptional LysR family regulator